MSGDAHFIDTNVVMLAVGKDHALKAPCLRILEAAAHGELVAVTSVEVLQELLHRYKTLGEHERAIEVVRSFTEIVPDVLPVMYEDVWAAIGLATKYPTLQTRDLIHVAVMTGHGISRIISADKHFDQVNGITRLDPTAWL